MWGSIYNESGLVQWGSRSPPYATRLTDCGGWFRRVQRAAHRLRGVAVLTREVGPLLREVALLSREVVRLVHMRAHRLGEVALLLR
jgi:hypothetical protein